MLYDDTRWMILYRSICRKLLNKVELDGEISTDLQHSEQREEPKWIALYLDLEADRLAIAFSVDKERLCEDASSWSVKLQSTDGRQQIADGRYKAASLECRRISMYLYIYDLGLLYRSLVDV